MEPSTAKPKPSKYATILAIARDIEKVAKDAGVDPYLCTRATPTGATIALFDKSEKRVIRRYTATMDGPRLTNLALTFSTATA